MILKITIKGFKSIQKLENFALRPLNVLIGANGSGKSNFIDFFRFLSECAKGPMLQAVNRRGGMDAILSFSASNTLDFSLMFEPSKLISPNKMYHRYESKISKSGYSYNVDSESLAYDAHQFKEKNRDEPVIPLFFAESGSGKVLEKHAYEPMRLSSNELIISQLRNPSTEPGIENMRRYLTAITCYYPFVVDVDSPTRKPQLLYSGTQEQPATRLLPTAENLSNVYHHLRNSTQKNAWNMIMETLSVAFPGFQDIIFPAEAGHGHIILSWVEKNFPDKPFSAYVLADGILKSLCLLAILFEPDPPPLVCIDEPENSMHPDLIRIFAELFVKASERTQLIISTHSPQLISYFQPEDIITVDKEKGESKYKRLKKKELSSWLREFSLGELWMQGGLGGRS